MSEADPIVLRPRAAGGPYMLPAVAAHGRETRIMTAFDRRELNSILAVYGRKVAAGEWRDYSIDLGPEKAVFSVFRRASEFPLFRIEKNPRLARKHGTFSVVAATGLILKRGHELARVLGVLEKAVRLVDR